MILRVHRIFQYMDYVNNLYSLQADWQYYDHFSSYKQYNDVPFACFDPELKDEAIIRAKNGAGLARNNMSVPGRCSQPPQFANTTRRQAPSVGSLSEGKVETRKIQYPLWILQFVSGFHAVLWRLLHFQTQMPLLLILSVPVDRQK